jgi:hypothetical protein
MDWGGAVGPYNFIPIGGDTPVHLLGAFELDIKPGNPDKPAAVSTALLGHSRG